LKRDLKLGCRRRHEGNKNFVLPLGNTRKNASSAANQIAGFAKTNACQIIQQLSCQASLPGYDWLRMTLTLLF
jgi:hypothetical protein